MKKLVVLLVFSLTGWALCGSIIGIGSSVTTMDNTLIIHLIFAPIIFIILSFIYHKFFRYTEPIVTAFVFMLFAMAMDLFIVAVLIIKSFDMFYSLIGTWIHFALIFLATFITGLLVKKA